MLLIAEEARSRFQPVGTKPPEAYLHSHPRDPLVALQWMVKGGERAGVWDKSTGRLVWAPEDCTALCWNRDGSEVYTVGSSYRRSRDHPAIIATPLQSEYTWFLERFTWPERFPVDVCEIRAPTGWIDDIVASPVEDLAIFMWTEQDCAGFEFIGFETGHPRQLRTFGYQDSPNTRMGPVFSPDGRWLAASYGNGFWWGDDPETPSPGGKFVAGKLAIGDLREGEVSRRFKVFPLEVVVPVGWMTQDPNWMECEFPSAPIFLDERHMSVTLPTGEERVYDVEGRLVEVAKAPGSVNYAKQVVWRP